MTLWLYNPSEPTGQPTSPGPPEIYDSSRYGRADLFTRGLCGNCAACPPVWRMVVPLITGNPYAGDYAGNVYFRRVPYDYSGVFTDYFASKCSWSSIASEPIADANRYQGPYGDGWQITFELNGEENGYTWSLYSPTETGNLLGDPANSRWICRSRFRCLQENTFQLYDNAGAGYAFPYAPESLTITPHYG